MTTLRRTCGAIVLTVLVGCCLAVFVLHSLYFIFRNAGDSQKTETKFKSQKQLSMPSLVICNRMPFSLDGLAGVNTNMRDAAAIRYLLEWTNPSIRESADYEPHADAFMRQGQNTVIQYLTQNSRNATILSMEYQCQSVINSCSFQGVQMSSFDCCRNIVAYVPTTQGLCWTWSDASLVQNFTGVEKQFVITFQMTRNSWYTPQSTIHPGIDIYLVETVDNPMRLAIELENPIRLVDKKGVRLRMRKTQHAETRRTECGNALGDSRRADESALKKNKTNHLMCNMLVAMKYCNCHPLMAEMLHYNMQAYRDFFIRVQQTSVCSVEAYDNCARKYVDMTRIGNWREDLQNEFVGRNEVIKCEKDNHRSCLITTYPGTIESFDLPADYQQSEDFVSRLVLEYQSMKVTETLISKSPNLYEVMSLVGYNLALWFTIGHIIWSVYWYSSGLCCTKTIKVTPVTRKPSVSSPRPVVVESTPAVVTVNEEAVIEEDI